MPLTALLFPGQASQYVGMGRDLHDAHPIAREMYESASAILGCDIAKLSFDGPADELVQTVNTQPAIFVHSCIAYRLAVDVGLTFDVAAGHSLGEYSALVASGVLSFEDGLTAVKHRSRFMQDACDANPGTMAAVLGLDYEAVTALCVRVSDRGLIAVAANYNAAAQIVISGSRDGVEAVSDLAREAGARRVVPLQVGGAFHSPLMQPSPERLAPVLDKLTFHVGQKPVILNVTAEPSTDPEFIRARLIDQLTAPVLWYPTMGWMKEHEVESVFELGPKRVLQGLAKPVLKGANLQSVDTASDVAALSEQLPASRVADVT